MIDRVLLFGATGDLAGRYLFPALAALTAAGELPNDFKVMGAAHQGLDPEAFRRHVGERLAEHASHVPADARDTLVDALDYRRVDVSVPASVADAVAATAGGSSPLAAYLALPPGLFSPTVAGLGSAQLPPGSRIVLEKPFGEDAESAEALNRMLAETVGADGEQAIFRVDHFLGLPTVQNLIGVRVANRVLEPIWSAEHIERVEIIWEETLALEGRAGYYDQNGQLRDMIQNHLLHILCLVAMEPPATLSPDDIRARKIEALRSIRPLTPADVVERTRRARYTAGTIGDRAIPSYADEEGVDPSRGTETFAQVEFGLDTPRWTGVPFVLRTAKGMGRACMEVVVRFKPVDHLPFPPEAGSPTANELRIGLTEPEHITLRLNGTRAGFPPRLMDLTLTERLPPTEIPEYGRVLLDILTGQSALAVRGDGAEEAWRLVTPILEAWANDEVPLEEYPAGSDGP